MKVILQITFIGLFRLVYSYENLSRRSKTVLTQSSTYRCQNVTFANDGKTLTAERYCASTDFEHRTAWLQADLGQSFSIKNVKLFFGNQDYWKKYRNRQFYLDVSGVPAKQTTTDQRTRCYTEATTAPNAPGSYFDLQCNHTARYVIVETDYVSPEENPPKGSILEICEIEIYGCEVGRFGGNCKQCSGCQTCDIVSGECVITGATEQQNVNGENGFILYAVIAVLCISFIMNGFMLTWILRHRTSRRKNATREIKRSGSQGIHNTPYQELGQVNGPSKYDQLQISSPGFIRR